MSSCLLMLFLFCKAGAGETNIVLRNDPRLLQGARTIQISVSSVSRANFQVVSELSLKKRGIPLVDPSQKPDLFLQLSIQTRAVADNSTEAISVRLEVLKPVRAGDLTLVNAAIWEGSQFELSAKAKFEQQTMDLIRILLSEFADDFLKANPKKLQI